MGIDVPIVISFIWIFITGNLFGWGLLKDRRFVGFGILLGLIYLFLDLGFFLTKKAWFSRIKIFLLLSFIAVAVFGTTVSFIQLRRITHVTGFINDSALQTEIAGRFLWLQKNPYTETYDKTDLVYWPYQDEADNKVNPALFQNVTPPFLIVLSALGFRVCSQLLGWFDIRIFFLLAYLSIIVWGYLKFGLREKYLIFLVLVGLNPLFLKAMMEGANDIFVLTLILWSLFFLEKKNYIFCGILLGLGIATKQTVWFILPFYYFYVWQKAQRQKCWLFILSSLVAALIFYLPFIVWNLPALISNLVFYASASPIANLPIHPIEGYGFGRLLLSLGLLKSIYDNHPFWLYQLGLGLPLIYFLLSLQKRKMTIAGLLYSYVAVLSTVWFFNRYFLESHLAFLMVLFSLCYLYGKN